MPMEEGSEQQGHSQNTVILHSFQMEQGSLEKCGLLKSKKSLFNPYVVGCAVLMAFNSILPGYAVGIMTGSVLFIKEDLKITDFEEEMLVGLFNIVSLLGSTTAGGLSDAIGRKRTIALGSLILCLASTIMGLATSYGVLLAGRLISGIGAGVVFVMVPVYLAELAPSESRGALTSLPEIFINIGLLLGFISSYVFAGLPLGQNWRWMFLIGAPLALVLACSVIFMPESPRWLVMKGKMIQAQNVLLKIFADKDEADLRLSAIKIAAGFSEPIYEICSEESLKTENTYLKKNDEGNRAWMDLLCPNSAVRKMLLVALGVHFFQQSCGIDALVYYTPEILKQAGMNSKDYILGSTVLIGVLKTLFIFVATALLDRLGRRPLLIISCVGTAAAMGILSFALKFLNGSDGVIPAMAAISLFMAFFSVGFGPIAGLLPAEIFPLPLRARAAGLGMVVNRIMSGVVSLTFLSISSAITPAGAFLMYSAIAGASAVFVYVMVPETKGKSLEEIGEMF